MSKKYRVIFGITTLVIIIVTIVLMVSGSRIERGGSLKNTNEAWLCEQTASVQTGNPSLETSVSNHTGTDLLLNRGEPENPSIPRPTPGNNIDRVRPTTSETTGEVTELLPSEPAPATEGEGKETQGQITTESTAYSVPTETVLHTTTYAVSGSYYSKQDAIDLAKLVWAEARGVPSVTEQACVIWTVLNRVDAHSSTVHSIVRAKDQYAFFESSPVDDDLYSLALDVLGRWDREKRGESSVGRVLPPDYTYFRSSGDGHNLFRNAFSGNFKIWDYSLPSPYKN